MTSDRRLRVGFVGLDFPVMEAGARQIFPKGKSLITKLSDDMGFELIAWPDLVSDKAKAAEASDFFAARGIDALLVQVASLIMGDVVLPLAQSCDNICVWVMDEPTYSGELPLNSLTGFNLFVSLVKGAWGDRKKIKWLWGMGPEFAERFGVTVRALSALAKLRASKILAIGDTVPTFDNLEIESRDLESKLSVRIEHLDLNRFFRLAENAGYDDAMALASELSHRAACVKVDQGQIDATARICHAIKAAKEAHGADAIALRCWPEFQTWKHIAPCAAVAWANDNCLPVSCEGDLPGAIAMYIGRLLSGCAATMNDPVALDRATGTVQMWHCGPGPASWADQSGQCLDYHHTLNRRLEKGEEKYGVSSDIRFAKGPATILRVRNDAKAIFAMECDIVDGPAAPYPGSGGWIGNMRIGDEAVSLPDLLQMMAAYGLEHHYPIMRGHHFETLREMAGWAGWEMLPRIDGAKNPVA